MGVRSWISQQTTPEVEQPAWAAALQELHDGDGIIRVPGRGSITNSHPFVREADLTVEEARTAFDYLVHTGLIEPVEGTEAPVEYVISKDGFQTAHNRELNQRQWELDLTSVTVAAALFVVTIMNILISEGEGLTSVVFVSLIGFIFIISLSKIPKYG